MSTSLEDRLRLTLAREAERGPVLQTLRARPAAHRTRRLQLATAATAAAVLAVAVTSLESSSGTAFAGWTSSPKSVGPAVTAALAKACGIGTPLIADVRGRAGYVVGVPLPGSTGSALNSAAIDCLTNVPGEPADADLRDSWFSGQQPPAVTTATPADPLVVLSAKAPEGNNVHQHDVTWVSGVVDGSVASVRISTSSGLVTATVSGGRFAAWWPGNDGDIDVVRAYAAGGTLLSSVDGLNCFPGGVFSPKVQLPGQLPTGGCTG